ncbi:IclR family transcriptional regulator [Rhabdothermincola sediminis]|uniref:IclR family transcriptional regulator n=1 Tax=Rhabdothermincola sediminis TaxID=2751370 RepID=UPI0027D9ED15|nr:IclR family transcriptional regulator [Rhabdothermincola sediminis]
MGVIDKAVAVLAALESGPRSLTGLVEASGLPRATAHRLAVALEVHGLVRRDEEGRFALGVRLVSLGRAAAEAIPLARAAGPALSELRDRTGESVQLYVREGDRRVCIAALESPHGLRTIVPMGASLPLGVGSAGRVLADEREGAKPWVASVGEREAGVASVSAAVRDLDGRVVAAVSVSGPIERTTRRPGRKYGDAVAAAARRIERSAGLA